MVQTIKDNKKLYLFWFVMIIGISLSVMTTNLLSLFILILFSASLLVLPIEDVFALLFGLMPFANIFKLGAGSTSLFTICEILMVSYVLFKGYRVNLSFLVSLTLLTFHLFVFSYSNFNWLIIVKVIIGFLLVNSSLKILKKKDIKNIAYLITISTILMLLLSMDRKFFAYIEPYFKDLDYYVDSTGHATETMRISGFLGDPNYCAVLIIAVIALLIILYYYKTIGIEFWVFSLTLIPLGFFTYSKSYFLCIVALVVLLIAFVLFPKHKLWACFGIVMIAIISILALNGKFEVLNMVFDRFEYGGDLTTGRDTLNQDYLEYIYKNTKTLFFGDGISTERFAGSSNNVHNIYIELVFKMGILGGLLYLMTLYASIDVSEIVTTKLKRRFVNYIPLLFVMVMFYFLAGILNYAIPFYTIIACMGLNYNCLPKNIKTD